MWSACANVAPLLLLLLHKLQPLQLCRLPLLRGLHLLQL
jgi:hypothetical protein